MSPMIKLVGFTTVFESPRTMKKVSKGESELGSIGSLKRTTTWAEVETPLAGSVLGWGAKVIQQPVETGSVGENVDKNCALPSKLVLAGSGLLERLRAWICCTTPSGSGGTLFWETSRKTPPIERT